MHQPVMIGRSGSVLSLVMNRPEKRNALTDAMYGTLADAIEAAATDPGVKVLLLRGEGETFTGGNDIGDFAASAAGSHMPRNAGRFIRAIASAPKPLLAAVQGSAVGIGTTMLLHCDQVILAEDARLTAPFVNLALVPEAGSSMMLPARIGHARAFAMFALGDAIDAPEALRLGLANLVVPAVSLQSTAEALAERLARQPTGALMATKRLMKTGEAVLRQMDAEDEEFLARLGSAEAKEAFAAFSERRAPDFTRSG